MTQQRATWRAGSGGGADPTMRESCQRPIRGVPDVCGIRRVPSEDVRKSVSQGVSRLIKKE